MFIENWRKVFDSNARIKKSDFMNFLLESPCKRMGIIKGDVDKLVLKPGKTLMILIGPSGAGKTTYAKSLRRAGIVSIDMLNVKYYLLGANVEQAERLVLENLEKIALRYREKYNLVVLDGSFSGFELRTVILKSFEDYFDNVIGVFFDTSFELLEKIHFNERRIYDPYLWQLMNNEWKNCQEMKESPEIFLTGVDEMYIKQRK